MVMHYCDRCGKKIVGPIDYVYRYRINWPYESYSGDRRGENFTPTVDLCDECYDSFVEWFDTYFTRVTKDKEENNEER